ncbi:MAG: transposase family protein [Zoogloeaceae bacterium]|jgi:hypothetical protein|nr:transposase family protein [Zoogloeaceae bacterium]
MFPNLHSYFDPRVKTLDKWHALSDIPGMTLFAVLSGTDTWVAVEGFCRDKEGALRQYWPCKTASLRTTCRRR